MTERDGRTTAPGASTIGVESEQGRAASAPSPSVPGATQGQEKTARSDLTSFFPAFFAGCEGKIEIRAIFPAPEGSRKKIKQHYFQHPIDAMRCAAGYSGKANVYFGIGTRMRPSGTKADVQEIAALWADCDSPGSVEALKEFPFPPSIVTESSPGRKHAYWQLREPLEIEGEGTIGMVEGVLRGIADILESDLTVCEVARVMRVPLTLNIKNGHRHTCRILESNDRRYNLSDFTDAGIFREKRPPAKGNGHGDAERNWIATALLGVKEHDPGRHATGIRLAGYIFRHEPPDIARAQLQAFGRLCTPPMDLGDIETICRDVLNKIEEEQRAASSADETPDDLNLPEIPAECWRQGFEDFRQTYTASSEGSDAYLFGAYATVAAVALGRNCALDAGVRVYCNLFVSNVGASGRSRKTTAQERGRELLQVVAPEVELSIGVGSPEGLLELFVGPDGLPRRVLLDFPETASLLKKGGQEGTKGLLPFITGLYDCPPSARLPNRKSDLKAVEPFLGILGSTTAEWLLGALSLDDVRGGLAGRFCYFTGREKAPIPLPPPPNTDSLRRAENFILEARDRHRCPTRHGMTDEAQAIWADWYTRERERRYPSVLLETLAQRLHLFAWKLGLIYCALERTALIDSAQIRAGVAFAEYQREVQAAVFEGMGDSEAAKLDKRIIAQLRRADLAGWELRQRVRHGADAETLARRLAALKRLGVIREVERGRGEAWHLLRGQE